MSNEARPGIFITEFRISNFMSIKEAVVPLQPLTVFIGPNNSGKTNFFRALQYFSQYGTTAVCISKNTEELVARGETNLFYNFETNVNIQLSISCNSGDQFHLKLAQSKQANIQDREKVEQEKLQSIFPVAYFNLRPEMIASQNAIIPNPQLGYNGTNLTALLDWLRGEYPGSYTTIEQELQRCVPEIEHIILKTVEAGTKQLGIQQKGCAKPFIGSEISEGVLTLIALLTICHQPDPPKIICLEEPENHIHPRRIRSIVHYLTDLAYHSTPPVQILISTHSPYLLDCFKDRLEEVIIVDFKHGQSTFSSMNQFEQVIHLKDDLPLGEMWVSGLLGGVPQP